MIEQRYFRAQPAVYDAIRSSLNAQWGFPSPGTESCISASDAASTPKDADGRVYLAVHADWCAWPEVADILPGLILAGDVEEVGRADYMDAIPDDPSLLS